LTLQPAALAFKVSLIRLPIFSPFHLVFEGDHPPTTKDLYYTHLFRPCCIKKVDAIRYL